MKKFINDCILWCSVTYWAWVTLFKFHKKEGYPFKGAPYWFVRLLVTTAPKKSNDTMYEYNLLAKVEFSKRHGYENYLKIKRDGT